jgi:hypothetical protein
MADPTAGGSDIPAFSAAGPKRRPLFGLFHHALGHKDDYIPGPCKTGSL